MNPPPSPTNGCTCGCHATGMDSIGPASWLTPEQVVEYVRGAITLGTLRNYRSARIGPRHLKVGRSIFYTVEAINHWLAELAVEDERRWRDQL
jgi:hypothetical protein